MIFDWIRFITGFAAEWSFWTTALVWCSVSATLMFAGIVGGNYYSFRCRGYDLEEEGLFFVVILSALWPLVLMAIPVMVLAALGFGFFYLVIRTARKLSEDLNARR